MGENKIDSVVVYAEFGYKVKYYSEDSKTVDWQVTSTADDELLLTGVFNSDNYYRSTFSLLPSKVSENTYETLFYLYFEYIKLYCIDIVEARVAESLEEM